MPEVALDLAKPFYVIKILDKDSNNLKFEWSPNIFMTTERPEDGSTIAPNTYIEDIEIKANFSPPINSGEIKINHNIGFTPNIIIKDILQIYFGYYTSNDPQTAVFSLAFTGKIDNLRASLNSIVVKASSKIKKIAHKRIELAFSAVKTLTEIIRELAIEDGGLEEAQNGISDTEISKQPGFAISKNLSIYEHIKKLADLAGFDVYMDPFDKFNARIWSPEEPSGSGEGILPWLSDRDSSESDVQNQIMHELYFGVNILDMELDVKGKKLSDIEIVTLADSEGDEIFTSEPPSRPAGGSEGGTGTESESETSGTTDESEVRRIVLSRVTKEDAEKIAEAMLAHNNSPLSGNLTVIGLSQIRLGDGLKLLGHIYGKSPFPRIQTPTSDYDASFTGGSGSGGGSGGGDVTTFKVSGLRHILNNKLGFITKLSILESTPVEITEEEEEAPEDEEEEEEEAITEEEEVEEEEEEEVEEEEQLVNIVVRTVSENNEVMPNTDYILITPEDEEIEGKTGDDGTYTHEEMPVGFYQLRFKTIENPEEEEEEGESTGEETE